MTGMWNLLKRSRSELNYSTNSQMRIIVKMITRIRITDDDDNAYTKLSKVIMIITMTGNEDDIMMMPMHTHMTS